MHPQLVLDIEDAMEVATHDLGGLVGGGGGGVNGTTLEDELKLVQAVLDDHRINGALRESSTKVDDSPENSAEDIVSDIRV